MPDGATCSLLALFLMDALIEQCKRVLRTEYPYYVTHPRHSSSVRQNGRCGVVSGEKQPPETNIAKNSQVCAELGHT
jgi:hypothetical protein